MAARARIAVGGREHVNVFQWSVIVALFFVNYCDLWKCAVICHDIRPSAPLERIKRETDGGIDDPSVKSYSIHRSTRSNHDASRFVQPSLGNRTFTTLQLKNLPSKHSVSRRDTQLSDTKDLEAAASHKKSKSKKNGFVQPSFGDRTFTTSQLESLPSKHSVSRRNTQLSDTKDLEDAASHKKARFKRDDFTQPSSVDRTFTNLRIKSSPSKHTVSKRDTHSSDTTDLEAAASHKKTKSKKYKKGGGKKYKKEHHSKHGKKSDKGYKKKHHHDKGEHEKHGKEEHSGHYKKEGGHKKKHHDSAKKYGAHHKGEKGHKGAKYGESGGHKKGHKTKGYHNKFHKDEYHKEHKFYDDFHKGGHHSKHGSHHSKHGKKAGKHKKGGHHKSAYHDDHYGKKGHHDKGHYDKHHKGHKFKKGHDEYHSDHHDYSKKKGHKEAKKYGYKKKHGH